MFIEVTGEKLEGGTGGGRGGGLFVSPPPIHPE